MVQRWYVRLALTAAIALGVAMGSARSQEPIRPPAPAGEPWKVIEFGGGAATHVLPTVEAPPEWPHKGPVRDWVHDCMHKHGVGCWSHFNAYTCGSFQSEFTFVFGSCKEFFGEPCLPGPPQPPYPPGYGPPPHQYGAGDYPQKAGCPFCR